jgi:hypothetical protein
VIDGDLDALPWPAMRLELLELGRQEARRLGVQQQEVEDAVQDTLRRMIGIGAAQLPACLLAEGRGRWLRLGVRNAILRIRDAELRWRQVAERGTAARRAAALAWPRHASAGFERMDLTRLWPEEVQVVVLLHVDVSVQQIAEIERLTAGEVIRRALWGALRGQEKRGSVRPSAGRTPGSLAGLCGAERREWIALLDRHGWPEEVIARDRDHD